MVRQNTWFTNHEKDMHDATEQWHMCTTWQGPMRGTYEKGPAQFVYVQYYDLIGEDNVPKDRVENKLGFIRLKWERHGEYIEG